MRRALQSTLPLLLLLLPTIASAKLAETFSGKVVGVSEGDILTVLRDKKPVKIRLHGVDCPEMKQPYGKKARQFTSKLVFGKVVKVGVVTVTKDRYRRTVGKVGYPAKLHRNPLDRRNKPHQVITVYRSLQQALVQAGLAWWHRKDDPKNVTLARLEATAKKAKVGLWTDNNAVPPWDWRRGLRNVIGHLRQDVPPTKLSMSGPTCKDSRECASRFSTVDRSRCNETGKRVVVFDLNNDKRPDVWKTYGPGKPGAMPNLLTCKMADLNFDNRKDVWRYYDPRGNVTMEEMDLDFDGQIDLVVFHRGKKTTRHRIGPNTACINGRCIVK